MIRKLFFSAVLILVLIGFAGCDADDGSDLRAVYSLTIQSGEARLYRMDGCDGILLADTSGEGTYELTIHAGKNFIVLDGTQFTGSLTLTVNPGNREE